MRKGYTGGKSGEPGHGSPLPSLIGRRFHDYTAVLTGATLLAAEETIHDGRELFYDVLKVKIFIVQLFITALAEPHEPVLLRPVLTDQFHDQAHRICGTLW